VLSLRATELKYQNAVSRVAADVILAHAGLGNFNGFFDPLFSEVQEVEFSLSIPLLSSYYYPRCFELRSSTLWELAVANPYSYGYCSWVLSSSHVTRTICTFLRPNVFFSLNLFIK
jgi:hypothetical protein